MVPLELFPAPAICIDGIGKYLVPIIHKRGAMVWLRLKKQNYTNFSCQLEFSWEVVLHQNGVLSFIDSMRYKLAIQTFGSRKKFL